MSTIDLFERPTAVYRFYDRAGTLLYVGITCDVKTRWIHHKRRAWWPLVDRTDVRWRNNRREALQEEDQAIKTESPVHNMSGLRDALLNKNRDGGADLYLSGPIPEKDLAQQILKEEGWQMKMFVVACLRRLLADPKGFLARLEPYWPEKRQSGRPKKTRD